MASWGRARLAPWWDGSDEVGAGWFGYPNSRGIRPVLTLTSRAHRAKLLPLALAALLLATALSAVAAFVSPSTTLGASTFTAKCDASLRTKPSTRSTRKAVLADGGQMFAVTLVQGGSWKFTCNGRSYSGRSWYKISNVNGRSARARYGVTYVYAATSLFARTTLYKKVTACDGVALRTKASTSATRKASLAEGRSVLVVKRVTGGSWSTKCGGHSESGNTWFRIAFVSGKTVSSRYGVTYVYAATSLFGPKTTTSTPEPEPDKPTSNLTEGIDVSHWQGTIDWAKVRAAGKKFAFIKASEHTSFVDDKYLTNRSRAKAAGVLVGAYHFARPNSGTTDAYAEADHFIETADWVSGELRPVLDLEDTGGLSSSALQTWVKAFVGRIYERTGVRAIIYVSPSFWSTKMGNSAWFAQNGYDVLWIAHWTTASSPSVPAENWGGKSWTFWQYTSDGSVAGISGRVDLDRYKGTDFSRVLIP
jgi:GH25 family lysozyme M1 (1,4-beta-N-acetylmuramidase)